MIFDQVRSDCIMRVHVARSFDKHWLKKKHNLQGDRVLQGTECYRGQCYRRQSVTGDILLLAGLGCRQTAS